MSLSSLAVELERREAEVTAELARVDERVALDEAATARGRLAALEADVSAARAERPELDAAASALAEELARLPRLSASGAEAPASLPEWRSRVRAALLVVRGGLVRE